MSSRQSSLNVGIVVGIVLAAVGVIGCLAGLGVWGASHSYSSTPEEHTSTPDDDGGSVVIGTTPDPDFWSNLGGPGADDGELHDSRNNNVDYQIREEMWGIAQTEHLDAYDMDVDCTFEVRYPKLADAGSHTDEVNELLKSTAMHTVRTYYEDPSDETVEMIKKLVSGSHDFIPAGADAMLSSEVDYAVSYNDARLLSVCFSDTYYIGSEALGFVRLRTVNVDLKTGKTYELDDVLTGDEDVATSFVDNLVRTSGTDENDDGRIDDDECSTVRIAGREALVEALQGKGKLAEERVDTCFYVDGNGQPNLGANYWVSGDDGFVRGWWDVTITDEQLENVRKDSRFWKLLGR